MRARGTSAGVLAWVSLLAVVQARSVPAAELVTLESRAVVAWPSLALREHPRADAPALAIVPFGALVAEVSSAEPGPSGSLAGLEGHWRRVHWGAQRGWMFDAWLLPLPAPPEPCRGLDHWVAGWEAEGAELTEWLADPATGDPYPLRVQHYRGGLQRRVTERAGAPVAQLWLPGIGVAQAWFVARRCVGALSELREAGWPPPDATSLRVRRSGESLDILDPGGATWLSVEQGPDGVWMAWW